MLSATHTPFALSWLYCPFSSAVTRLARCYKSSFSLHCSPTSRVLPNLQLYPIRSWLPQFAQSARDRMLNPTHTLMAVTLQSRKMLTHIRSKVAAGKRSHNLIPVHQTNESTTLVQNNRLTHQVSSTFTTTTMTSAVSRTTLRKSSLLLPHFSSQNPISSRTTSGAGVIPEKTHILQTSFTNGTEKPSALTRYGLVLR